MWYVVPAGGAEVEQITFIFGYKTRTLLYTSMNMDKIQISFAFGAGRRSSGRNKCGGRKTRMPWQSGVSADMVSGSSTVFFIPLILCSGPTILWAFFRFFARVLCLQLRYLEQSRSIPVQERNYHVAVRNKYTLAGQKKTTADISRLYLKPIKKVFRRKKDALVKS